LDQSKPEILLQENRLKRNHRKKDKQIRPSLYHSEYQSQRGLGTINLEKYGEKQTIHIHLKNHAIRCNNKTLYQAIFVIMEKL
jgi:hypothetical protein